MLINAGIKKIYYQTGYADDLSRDLLDEAGVEVIHYDNDPNVEGGAP
jgi:dCMP deaminase